MKKYFIVCLLYTVSCSSIKHEAGTNYNVSVQYPKYINEIERIGYRLDKHNFLSFTISEIDSETGEWYKYLTFFSQKNNTSEQIVSKTDLTDGFYGDTLIIYKAEMSDKQVIVWKQEGEYWSYLNVFLFAQDNIFLIGDLSLGLDCKNCDTFNFPLSKIEIREKGEILKVKFEEQALYRGSITQGTPYHSVNIKTDKLTLLYKESRSKLSY